MSLDVGRFEKASIVSHSFPTGGYTSIIAHGLSYVVFIKSFEIDLWLENKALSRFKFFKKEHEVRKYACKSM